MIACWFLEWNPLVQQISWNKELCNHFVVVCDEKDIVFNCFVATLDQELSTRGFMVIPSVNQSLNKLAKAYFVLD